MLKPYLCKTFLISSEFSILNQDYIDYFFGLSLLMSMIFIQISVPAGSREAVSYLIPGL